MNKFSSNNFTKLFLVFLSIVIASVIIICDIGINSLEKGIKLENKKYVDELTKSVADSFNKRIENNINALEIIAMEIGKGSQRVDLESLNKSSEIMEYEHIYILYPNGMLTNGDIEIPLYEDLPEIMEVFEGKNIITRESMKHLGNDGNYEVNNGFTFAVPVYDGNGQVVKAVVACTNADWNKDLSSQSYFDGAVYFHIIDTKGNYVIQANNAYSQELFESDKFKIYSNIYEVIENNVILRDGFTLEDYKRAVEQKEKYVISFCFRADNLPRLAELYPLEYGDLLLILSVAGNATTLHMTNIMQTIVILNIVIVAFFVLLSLVLFLVYKNSRSMALEDSITKGYSNLRFQIEAKEKIEKSPADTYAFLSVNIDRFKIINDMFGTEKGDETLKFVHDKIKQHLKNEELICRSSSDNFDVLIKNRTDSEILKFLSEIVEDIVKVLNEKPENKNYLLSLSVGVYHIDDTSIPIVNIRDRAIIARKKNSDYIVKHICSCGFYSDEERERLREEKEMENKMESALINNEFVVYLQPKVNFKDGKFAGAEALVRWFDKDKGMIPPDKFISFFEKNGFINKLDIYVFEQTCKYIRKWIDAGVEPVPVSINLSRAHLENKDFLKPYVEIQKKYNIPSKLLELELTENLLLENPKEVMDAIKKIHQAGFLCSLDDFGSGYSSLNILKDLDVDIIKLDRAFFRSPDVVEPKEKIIVGEVVSMARQLGMMTVSEGVETEAHVNFLKEIDCDKGQGYFFSRPISEEDFEVLVYGRKL